MNFGICHLLEQNLNSNIQSDSGPFQPKYIQNLLTAAENRKKEDERRTERKVQKEREDEGDEFRDKEAFVTSAYKKKMEEMQSAEEAERRQAQIEGQTELSTLSYSYLTCQTELSNLSERMASDHLLILQCSIK